MSDDVKDGGTSTATEEVSIPIQEMTPTERTAFLKDGTLPQRAKQQVETTSDGEGKTSAETAAASDAAKKDNQESNTEEPPKRESRAERRIRKLTDENKQLRAQLEARPESKPPAESTRITEVKLSKAPKLKSFTDKIGAKDGYSDWDIAHEAYEEAVEAFHEEQRKTAVADAIKAEYEKLEAAKADELARKQLTKSANEFADRAKVFRETLPQDDFSELFVDIKEAIDEAMSTRPEMADISNVFVESELGPELVYYYGKHPDEFDALLEMPLRQALREIGKLEVSDKIKAHKPKTITAAKKTTPDVSGRQSVPEDALETAIDKKDSMGYIREANKRDGVPTTPRWGH